jgi:carboxyl-terminal processing protease
VLVDHGTRSGKEILAHAFKTSKRAVLVGERTAGAVVGGRPYVLSDGSLLLIAVQDVQVDGVRLEGVGVEPDVEVKWDIRFAAGDDPQLKRALEIAGADDNKR